MERILIVDDERSMREFLTLLLKKEGYGTRSASNLEEAVKALGEGGIDLVITDLKLPDGTGLSVLKKAKEIDPDTQVVVITAFGTADTAVEAMKNGAYDYIGKPFKVDRAQVTVRKALEKCSLARENRELKRKIAEAGAGGGEVFGASPRIKELFNLVERVANTDASVLVLGESGTGKELVARRIHRLSGRKGSFVPVNCSAIPEGLIESELFGHAKGSFTGATSDKTGLFVEAAGGTLFLDEVGELPLSLQPKLLRALQEGRIRPVGTNREVATEVRIISATNKDLLAEVREGRFREDLYYRLNVLTVELPPLRDRPEEIPLLAEHFLYKYCARFNRAIKSISPDVIECLMGYSFPGNVRELENIIERAVALETGDILSVSGLPPGISASGRETRPSMEELTIEGLDLDRLMDGIELSYINKALALTGGNRTRAAELLSMTFRSFRYRLKKHGMDN